MEKCQLKCRVDDIPKRKTEKSWHCDTCGALLFATKKPQCVRALIDNARAQAKIVKQKLNIKD